VGVSSRAFRRTAVVGSAFVASAILAGCTGSSNGSEPTPTPTITTSAAPEPVQLRLSVYGDEQTVAMYQDLADAYTAEHPEVTFEISSTTEASASAEASLGAIASGVDAPDVFLLDVDHLPAAVAADALQPVAELMEARDLAFGDGFQRTALTAYSANDDLACMPNDVSPLVAFYNRQLIKPRQITLESGDEVGPLEEGWTWETFIAAAEQAAARGAKGGYLPADLEQLSPFILSAGGAVVDDDREPSQLRLSDENTREALRTLAAFTRDPRLALTPADVRDKPAVDWFAEGELGVLIGTRAMVPQLREVDELRFDVAPLPRIDDVATTSVMNAYCISKTSEHVEAAADFIAWAVDGDGVDIALESGAVVPSQLDALHSPEFLQPGQLPRSGEVFAEGARRSVPTPYSTQWLAAVAAANPTLQRVLYGRALDVASEETPELDALLEETDESSKAIFNPPTPTASPAP
jgi:multiple sugar transport system substrate-binding protein